MKCKAIVALPVMTINGKKYKEGEVFGEVEITDAEFNLLNNNPNVTGLKYEKIIGNDITEERKKLEDKAKELKIDFRANIGDAKLLEKIQTIEPEFKL